MNRVARLVDRPVYSMAQVDRILGLHGGTARRWIDGYDRGAKSYPPVIRQERTNEDTATWGEFVETRLLAEFRDAGVPMIRMRPAVERLRRELETPYPLASARTWLYAEGQELVRAVQDEVGLDSALQLVVVRSNQRLLWSQHAESFRGSLEWTNGDVPEPRLLHPMPDIAEVQVDPLRGYGEPVVRNVPTEVIAELIRAGETPDSVADMYELNRSLVDAAVRYELKRAAA